MVVSKFIKVYLISHKSKTFTKCHDEVLDIIHNILFNDTLVYFLITHTELLNIDEIEQIFIFKHLYSTKCLFIVWHGSDKVVWQRSLMMVEILFLYDVWDLFCRWLIVMAITDIEHSFINVLGILNNAYMMGKTDTEKFDNREIGIIRQLQLANCIILNINSLQRISIVL